MYLHLQILQILNVGVAVFAVFANLGNTVANTPTSVPTSMSSGAVHSEPFWASMREQCSAPQLCALLRFGGVHLKHVPASLGQRVPMASACLLVTYIKYVDPAGASSHLHRRRTSIIMVIQRSETCE